jgi:hypothetical protein
MVGLQSGIELKAVDGPAVRQEPFDPTDGSVQLAASESVVKVALLSGVTKAYAGDAETRRAPTTKSGTPTAFATRPRPTRLRRLDFNSLSGSLQATCSIGSRQAPL